MRRIAVWLVSFAMTLVSVGSVAADPPSIADFLADSEIVDLALAPNGARFAVMVNVEGRDRVQVMRVGDLELAHTIHLGEDMEPLWVEWANDDRVLVAVMVGEFRVTASRITFPSARILAIDANGENPVVLFDNQRSMLRRSLNLASVTDILPNDREHVLMPGYRNGALDLWKVNVYTGAAENVAEGGPDTFQWRTDSAGRPAFRYDTNARGTMLRILAPDAEGRWRRVASVREEDLPEFQPVAVGPSPDESYVLARPEGADRAAVYLYNFTTGSFSEPIASHPRVDITGVFINPRTNEYLGYYTFDDIYETSFVDRSLQAHITGLRRYFGADMGFSIVDMSNDRSVWIVSASGPSDPGEYYLYDSVRRHIEPLARRNSEILPNQLGPSRVVRYTTRDGAEVTGYLTLPPNAGEGPHPLIIMPHGGPELRDIFTYEPDAQFLATRGYAVFRPNFRGSSGYGRAFAEAGYGQWGGRMQDDLTDAVMHLASTGVIDPTRVCIMGGSYGGYAALAGAAYTPNTFRCAISIAGVSDLVEQARYVVRVGDEDDAAYIRRSIGDPRTERERLMGRSPVNAAASITIPVLLLHGDQDSIVTVEHSRRMDRALRQAGRNVRYVELEGEGHSYWSDENQTTLYREVEAFLAQHLPVER
jgi:dipeptidyl aminopeptidase/acylaminoacyl peptidase